MTAQFDPGDDFSSVIDGLESVTLTRSGSSTPVAIDGALRRAVTTAEAEALRSTFSARSSPSQGKYTASDVAWHLPASALSEPPLPGDVIEDGDSRRWTVLAVVQAALDSRWRCVSRNLAIAAGLDQYVDIERATHAKSDGGAAEPTWNTWRTGLAARIQPMAAEVGNVNDRQVTTTTFKVFLAEPVVVDHTHRLKGPDGTVYRITGYKKPERIDALMEIDAVRTG